MFLRKYPRPFLTLFLVLAVSFVPLFSMAAQPAVQQPGVAPGVDEYTVPRYMLAGIAILLLFVIGILGNAVSSAGLIFWEKEQRKGAARKLPVMLPLLLLSLDAVAEDTAGPAAKTAGLPVDIYILLIIVGLELILILALAKMLLQFLHTQKEQAIRTPKLQLSFSRLNQTVALEEEHLLDMNHDYDGIRELDNKVPAWWRYAFYASILFGIVYLYRMFGNESIPGQLQELQAANRQAALAQEEYLKNAANNIDENNVAMMDAPHIAAGNALYTKNCLACHGDRGQGGVGPNLTDDYWLHGGNIKDIFKSIKYGWQEKGMKAWKDDFSPQQLAEITSFVKSLHGTNPPAAKEPQGTLFTEAAVADNTDTAKAKL
jgi:cytochrome c oxidase cbb3-type subunit 3